MNDVFKIGWRDAKMGNMETRKKILKAAKEMFLEKGFLKSTIDDITKRSNISHGTFYIYFKNKKQLLMELVELTSSELYKVTESPWGKGDIFHSLHESITGFLQIYQSNLSIIKAWREIADSDEMFMKAWDELFKHITERIEKNIARSIDKGLVDPVYNSKITAQILSGMVEQMAYNLFIKELNFDMKETADTLTKIWYNAIYLK